MVPWHWMRSEEMERKKAVLIVGGSGYLGLHLLEALLSLPEKPYHVAFTYNSNPPPPSLFHSISPAHAFKVDLQSGEGFDSVFATLGMPLVVINCAAVSIPRTCELHPSLAIAVNVPCSLINWLSKIGDGVHPLLIHLSTDQVYEGTKSFYKEDDEANPVNVYGKSKLMAEDYIRSNYSSFVILRSSIIYGPQPIIPVKKSLPIQWMNDVLAAGKVVEFFHDEFRCPIFIKDIVNIILSIIKKSESDGNCMQMLLNTGGPDRVSRANMAEIVAELKGYNGQNIRRVSAQSVDRGVASPADISMDISKLVEAVGITLTLFKDGAQSTLESVETD